MPVIAGEVRVAVAGNFYLPAQALVAEYERQSGERVVLINGSTGKLYAQIQQGAPFDILLAADTERPRLLEEAGQVVKGSRFTYALGQLVLWSSDAELGLADGVVLKDGSFTRLAIANPKLAPYGRAAEQTLSNLGLWEAVAPKLVRGESVTQAWQFAASGNAQLGLIALSQAQGSGSFWLIPAELYEPVEQQAVLLTDADESQRFYRFLRSVEAAAIIRSYGYRVLQSGE